MNAGRIMGLIAAAVCIFSLSACSLSEKYHKAYDYHLDLFAMDTVMTITVPDVKKDPDLSAESKFIRRLEELFSVNKEGSDIWNINHSGGKPVEVSDETAELLRTAVEIGNETGGALDITTYNLLIAWGFTTDEKKIPSDDEIKKLLEFTDYRQIKLDGNTVTVPEGYMLDLGALAKGYASDRLAELLIDDGIDKAIINLGGNVRTIGEKDGGWKVLILDPFDQENSVGKLTVGECAVVTSGNYERFFVGDDGQKYWHIIDPFDGRPADNGLVSVTIIDESGLRADALSTALFVLGTDKAIKHWRAHNDYDMVLVTDSNKVLYTEGLNEKLTLTGNDRETEVLSLD